MTRGSRENAAPCPHHPRDQGQKRTSRHLCAQVPAPAARLLGNPKNRRQSLVLRRPAHPHPRPRPSRLSF